MASKAIVGEKVGMTQVWDEQNRAVPVTVLKVAPMRVVRVKTVESDRKVDDAFVGDHLKIGIDSLKQLINKGVTVKHLKF